MSKVNGTMYKCDKCGEKIFLSTENINSEKQVRASELSLGIHRLNVGTRNLHFCETCYLSFGEWFGEETRECVKIPQHRRQKNER